MYKNKKQGFSMSEILVAMSIVGVLCTTVLAMNNEKAVQYSIAQTQFEQIDTALKIWSKNVSKSNETGIGILSTINNQDSLVSELEKSLNSKEKAESGSADVILNINRIKHKKYTTLKLSNNTLVNVKYIEPKVLKVGGMELKTDIYNSTLAYVTVCVPVGKTAEYISSSYEINMKDGIHTPDTEPKEISCKNI